MKRQWEEHSGATRGPAKDRVSGRLRLRLLAALVLTTGLVPAGFAANAAEPGLTDDTIKIGMFGPLTGPVSIYGYPINNGAIALYEELNANGGVHGRKIEIAHEDGGCDPAKTRAAVKKLIHNDQVFMIHGGSCSSAVFAARDDIIEAGIPFMVMAATMDRISAPVVPNIFTTTLPASRDGATMFTFVQSIPDVKKVAIVKHEDEWADSKSKAIFEGLEGSGIELVANESIERKAADATSQVLRVQQAEPDATLIVAYPGETAVFLRDALKYGLTGPFVATTSVMDMHDLANRAGSVEAVRDVYAVSFLKGAVGSDHLKKYEEIYARHFPDDKVQALSFYAMSGANAVIQALQAAGPELTRDKVIAALESIDDGDAASAYCEIDFSAESHQACLDGTMWTLHDGEIVSVGPTWRELD